MRPIPSRPVVFRGRFASSGLQVITKEPNVGPPSATRLPADVQIGSFLRDSHSRDAWPSMGIDSPRPRLFEIADDTLAGQCLNDLSADDWHIAPLNPLPCPITVAWSEEDALLPMAEYARALPERLPQATFKVLAGVGHDPMIDDPPPSSADHPRPSQGQRRTSTQRGPNRSDSAWVLATTRTANWRNCGEGRAQRRAKVGFQNRPERTSERADSGRCSAATSGGRGEAGHPAEDPRCPLGHHCHGAV